MNRHLRIGDVAIAGLLREGGRTLAVVVVYAALVGLVVSLLLYVRALRREAHALLASAPEIVVQRLTGGRHDLTPVERAAEIAGIRGVAGVVPRVWGYYFDPPSGATLTVWGADSVPADSLDFVDGAPPGPGRPDFLVVGSGLADARFLALDERFPIRRHDGSVFAPRVSGIFRTDSAVLTNDLLVLPEDDVRAILGIGPGACTDLAVTVRNPNEVTTVARKIQQRWPDARVIPREQILGTYEAVFDWRGGVWAAALLGAVAAFGILVWTKASGLSAEEYRTIGILKAVGWSPREVLELKVWEGAIVSVTSVVSGILGAQVHLLWFDGALFSGVLKGWSVLFPPFELSAALDGYTLLTCVPIAVVPYVVAGLVPAWRAATLDPDTVIRS